MFAMLLGLVGKDALLATGKAVGAALAVCAVCGVIYLKGRVDGRAGLTADLAADRVTVLVDGKEIDEKVLGADDPVLCALLGGCLVPEHAGGD